MKLLILCIIPDIVAAAVLSGNRNFEGRVHPLTRANYLGSPPLVVAYALAGTVCCLYLCVSLQTRALEIISHLGTMVQVNIDFETEPIGLGKDGKKIFFRDIWPSNEEVANVSYSTCLSMTFTSRFKDH